MRFVPTKTPEQQSCLMLHRTRHLFIRQQTAVINSIRAHLAEFGIVAPVGRKGVTELLHVVADPNDGRVPEVARACLAALGTQLLRLKEQILEFDQPKPTNLGINSSQLGSSLAARGRRNAQLLSAQRSQCAVLK
jgi:transposase